MRRLFGHVRIFRGALIALTGFGSFSKAIPQEPITTIFVAVNGNDAASGLAEQPAPGSNNGPVASLGAARDILRRLRKSGKISAHVVVKSGTYRIRDPISFGSLDCGGEGEVTEYIAEPGTVLSGGMALSHFSEVTDKSILERLPPAARDHVQEVNLKALGITDYGKLTCRGYGQPLTSSHMELFYHDAPMALARWPNGQGNYETITAVPNGKNGSIFVCAAIDRARLERWKQEKDPWAYGYWYFDWADEYTPLKVLDVDAGTLDVSGGKLVYGLRQGQRFNVLNMLCELDEPGEWYCDREAGMLYFWPPSPIEDDTSAQVSMSEGILDMEKAHDLSFRGFTMECCRGTAVTIRNSSSVKLVGCKIENIGSRGVVVNGGKACEVSDCKIDQTGDGGVWVAGGDRVSLTPCNHLVKNNHIFVYSRWCKTYRPAIDIEGVGVRAANNLLEDGQHEAIQIKGNDHLVELNEIRHVVDETGDAGAIYIGRDWTQQGIVVRHNYFHDITGAPKALVRGIYLDDEASGVDIEGNLFENVTNAADIGGGEYNTVEGNVFVLCNPALHIDIRRFTPETFLRPLSLVPYTDSKWTARYPHLADIVAGEVGNPCKNVISDNLACGGDWIKADPEIVKQQTFDRNRIVADTFGMQPSEEPTPAQLKALADFCKSEGFTQVPFEKIGLNRGN